MASKRGGLDVGNPWGLYRYAFTDLMLKLNKLFTQPTERQDQAIRTGHGWLRDVLEPLLQDEDAETYRDELKEIEKDESYLETAKQMQTRRDQDPRLIAERLRMRAKRRVLIRLAVDRDLWGSSPVQPDPTAPDAIGDDALALPDAGEDEATLEA